MADATKELQLVISAKDEASQIIQSFGDRFNDLARQATAGSAIIAGGLGLIVKSSIDAGSEFQQARVAFDTMLGSADKAGKLLDNLSKFAAKTPFTLPDALKGAKSLMAMGTSAEDVIPELKAIGDVAAGTGAPLERLVFNFGQVRTQGKLTGRDLRDFAVNGVPIIDALVSELNKNGGALTTVGATSDKTKAKIDQLNLTLKKQTNRLNDMTASGKTSSASYKNLQIDIENTKNKIASLGPVTSGFQQHIKVTKKDISDMVSAGEISFDMVKQAFIDMSSAGGKFNNLMDRQSKTVPGIISNISDNMIRLGSAFIGVSTSGEVIAGGLFEKIASGLNSVLDVLNYLQPRMSGFMNQIMNNTPVVVAILGSLIGVLYPLVAAFIALIAPALLFMAVGTAIGAVVGLIISKFNNLGISTEYLKGKLSPFISFIETKFERLKQILNGIGISGQFGGVRNFFTNFEQTFSDKFQRILQIATRWKDKIQNILAFGSDVPGLNASWIDAFTGVWNRLKPLIDAMAPAFQIIGQNIALTGQIIQTQLIPAWDALMAVLTPFIKALAPYIKDFLIDLAMTFGVILVAAIVTVITIFTGFVTAVSNALPYVIQALEGFVQFVRGFIQVLTGLLTGNVGLILEGMKQMFAGAIEFVTNILNSFVKFLTGFVKGVLSVVDELTGGWISKFGKIKDAIFGVVGAIGSLIAKANDLASKVAGGLRIPGFQHGGFVPGSFNTPVPAILHGGERVIPRVGTDVNPGGGSGGGLTINFNAPVNMDSESRVDQLAQKVIDILGRQNELSAKGLST